MSAVRQLVDSVITYLILWGRWRTNKCVSSPGGKRSLSPMDIWNVKGLSNVMPAYEMGMGSIYEVLFLVLLLWLNIKNYYLRLLIRTYLCEDQLKTRQQSSPACSICLYLTNCTPMSVSFL